MREKDNTEETQVSLGKPTVKVSSGARGGRLLATAQLSDTSSTLSSGNVAIRVLEDLGLLWYNTQLHICELKCFGLDILQSNVQTPVFLPNLPCLSILSKGSAYGDLASAICHQVAQETSLIIYTFLRGTVRSGRQQVLNHHGCTDVLSYYRL